MDRRIPGESLSTSIADAESNLILARNEPLDSDGLPLAATPAPQNSGLLQSQGPGFRKRRKEESVLRAAFLLRGKAAVALIVGLRPPLHQPNFLLTHSYAPLNLAIASGRAVS